MSRGSKMCRREKNKWQRELEQIVQDENDEKLECERDLYDALYEAEYARDVEDGLFDNWYNSDYDGYYGPDSVDDFDSCYDDLDYIDEFDDWHLDSRTYADAFAPGSHVQNNKDVYLVLTTNQFANLRTGEVVRWLDHAELIWGS